MSTIGIIPARYEATRFKGKVLADINGKPMIQHVWENAKQAKSLDDLIVAADDERIIKAVKDFGGKAVFTAKGHQSGSDRLREIVNPMDVDVIVNIQGDEPLLVPSMVDSLVSAVSADKNIPMASLMKRIENIEQAKDPNVVKVVVDKNSFALYFSRSPIPYVRDRDKIKDMPKLPYFKHIGLYAYTKDFLFVFGNLPESMLEQMEKLEQLRALESGYRIKMVETTFDTVGVDTPKDLEDVKRIIASREGRELPQEIVVETQAGQDAANMPVDPA